MNGTNVRNKLASLGPASNGTYTNQEIVDQLKELQNAIAREVCGVEDSMMRADDIVRVVEERVTNLGLQDSACFASFKQDMMDLGREIALTISGLNGEMKGFRALKPLEFDNDTHVLRNICLKSDDGETEIDAVVLTPYGIFIIEMKGCRKPVVITEDGFFQKVDNPDYQYPLGERMCCKETLLREAAGAGPDVPIYQALFLVNDSEITDRFGKIMTANRNTIVYKIRSYAKESEHLSGDRVSQLVDRIESSRIEAKYPCSLDCERLIENLADLMDQIESAELAKTERAAKLKPTHQPKTNLTIAVAAGFAAGVAGCAMGILGPLAINAIKAR